MLNLCRNWIDCMLGYTTSAVPGENHTLKENYGLSVVTGLGYGNCHLEKRKSLLVASKHEYDC